MAPEPLTFKGNPCTFTGDPCMTATVPRPSSRVRRPTVALAVLAALLLLGTLAQVATGQVLVKA